MRWADERADVALGTRPSACKANRPVSGRGQGRQPPKAGARSASLEPGRSLVYFNTVAPRRSGFFVSVVCGIRRLDAGVEASGPHDFTVRISTVRQWHFSVHRIPPRVRDDRDTPLMWGRTARDIEVIWVKREEEYFCNQDWTGQITLIEQTNLVFFEQSPAGCVAP